MTETRVAPSPSSLDEESLRRYLGSQQGTEHCTAYIQELQRLLGLEKTSISRSEHPFSHGAAIDDVGAWVVHKDLALTPQLALERMLRALRAANFPVINNLEGEVCYVGDGTVSAAIPGLVRFQAMSFTMGHMSLGADPNRVMSNSRKKCLGPIELLCILFTKKELRNYVFGMDCPEYSVGDNAEIMPALRFQEDRLVLDGRERISDASYGVPYGYRHAV